MEEDRPGSEEEDRPTVVSVLPAAEEAAVVEELEAEAWVEAEALELPVQEGRIAVPARPSTR